MRHRFSPSILLPVAVALILFSCNNSGSDIRSTADSTKSTASADTVTQKKVYLINDSLFKKIHLCTEMLPPSVPSPGVNTFFLKRSDGKTDTIIRPRTFIVPRRLSSQKAYVWHKDTLNVMFLDGDPVVQQKVIATAKKWENYCHIRFKFGQFDNPDITISFLYDGSWSYIGSYSRKVRPSMNFGWLDRDTPPNEYDRVVLHEFGHALSFVHEHQVKDANIPWNTDLVYQYYAKAPNFWSRGAVDSNIFMKYPAAEITGTPFDPKSIMLYEIPAELTYGGYHTDPNDELSPHDIYLVDSIYPKRK